MAMLARRLLGPLLAAATALGCQGAGPVTPPATTPKPAGTKRPAEPTTAPTGTPAPTATPGTTAAKGFNPAAKLVAVLKLSDALIATIDPKLISDNGIGIVGNNGGALISDNGIGVVSNNGSNVVSNNGSNVVANGGARYSLHQAPAQKPVKGLLVHLEDGAGKTLTAPDGKPLEARTDAEGRVGFGVLPPAGQSYVLVADLGGGATARAIAPQDRATGPVLDVDLVSTLTSGYILDQYVRPLADPAAALAKLPAAIEAQTRAKAFDALAAGRAAAPDRLAPLAIVAAVEALRRADPALNTQLEDVRRLFIAAGSLDLGDGEPATAVAFSLLDGMVAGPDGTIYLNAPLDERLWALRPDAGGVLRGYKVLDGTASLDDRQARDTGVPADLAKLRHPQVRDVDALGRLILTDNGLGFRDTGPRVRRRALDGTLTTLLPGGRTPDDRADDILGAFAGVGDEVLAVDRSGRVHRLVGGKDETTTLIGDALLAIPAAKRLGRDAAGRWYALTDGEVRRFPPAGGPGESLAAVGKPFGGGALAEALELTVRGELVARLAGGALATLAPDGQPVTYGKSADRTPKTGRDLPDDGGVAIAPDGSLVTSDLIHVHRWAAGGAAPVHLAGSRGQPTGEAGAVTYSDPNSVATLADGTLFVADFTLVQRIRGGVGAIVLGDKVGVNGPATGVGGPATAARLTGIDRIRTTPDGALWVSCAGRELYRIGADGKFLVAYTAAEDEAIKRFERAPDGGLVVVAWSRNPDGGLTQGARIIHLDAAGRATAGERFTRNGGFWTPAYDRQGRLWIAGAKGELARVDGAAITTVHASVDGLLGANALAFDDRDRLYAQRGELAITRIDVATGATTKLVGAGGSFFQGTTPDTSTEAITDLALDAAGNLLFPDQFRAQIKRIPADQLP